MSFTPTKPFTAKQASCTKTGVREYGGCADRWQCCKSGLHAQSAASKEKPSYLGISTTPRADCTQIPTDLAVTRALSLQDQRAPRLLRCLCKKWPTGLAFSHAMIRPHFLFRSRRELPKRYPSCRRPIWLRRHACQRRDRRQRNPARNCHPNGCCHGYRLQPLQLHTIR